jgi:hypothetical protein
MYPLDRGQCREIAVFQCHQDGFQRGLGDRRRRDIALACGKLNTEFPNRYRLGPLK